MISTTLCHHCNFFRIRCPPSQIFRHLNYCLCDSTYDSMSSGRRRAYRPGQKPEWAQEKPQEHDKQQLNVGKRNVVPRKQIVLNLKEHEAVIEEDEDVTAVIEEEEEDQNAKPVFDISALEVPEPEEELDASELHLRRYEQGQEEQVAETPC